MEWKTKITDMLGCRYPILLGAFAGYDDSQLAGAISKAGGFGVLTAGFFKQEDQFQNAILKIKKITNNPFGINFTTEGNLHPDHRFYPFLEIARNEGIKTIITAVIRDPSFGNKAKTYGMDWFHKVTTMRHATKGIEMGADGIILTGLEGGGFKSPKQAPLFINLVNAKRILKDVPFIASGGISTGEGMLATLVAGAQAVHMCMAFLATKESPIADDWKQEIVQADCFDPKVLDMVCHFPGNRPKTTQLSMAVGTIKEVLSAEQVVQNIVIEAETILKKLGFPGEVISFI